MNYNATSEPLSDLKKKYILATEKYFECFSTKIQKNWSLYIHKISN